MYADAAGIGMARYARGRARALGLAAAVLAWCVASMAAVVAVPAAQAGDTTQCTGAVTGTHDNVVVPKNATCDLFNATVLGNVKALPGSDLLIDTSNIRGSVEAEKARNFAQVLNSTVRENIILKEGGFGTPGGPFDAAVCGVIVEEGNVQIEKTNQSILVGPRGSLCGRNTIMKGNVQVKDTVNALTLLVLDNTIAQNLQVSKNAGPGGKQVVFNTAASIQCFENDLPFTGVLNNGTKEEGQCS